MYENNIQAGMWSEALRSDSSLNTATSSVVEPDGNTDNRSEGASRGNEGLVTVSNGGENKLSDNNKTSRRLAQNREAARKSRLRKKAYVQQLESSRMKLTQLEQELERARKQGVVIGGSSGESNLFGSSAAVSSGVAQFEMEYGHWVEELVRRNSELRNALQAHVTDIELRILVEGCLGHYDDLFRMKAIVAKSDVFYLMSGMWRTTAERFFLWIGGYRPSEMLKVLTPQLDPLTEQQLLSVSDLQQSSQENEDALSQSLDKLLVTLAETLVSVPLGASDIANCRGQMATSMEKLDELVTFLNQADNLRQQMLRQMHQILTTRQAARGLLALGDYFQRLRALSSLWAARPRETA